MMAPRDQICSPRPVEVASAVEKLRHAGCFPGSQLSILQTKSKLPKFGSEFSYAFVPCLRGNKIRKGNPGQEEEEEERPAEQLK